MKDWIAVLIFLPLFTACWWQNFAVPEPSIPESTTPQVEPNRRAAQPTNETPAEDAGRQLADPGYLPPRAILTDFRGGLRAITRTLFAEIPSSSAYLQLTLPSPGANRYGLPLLLAEAAVSAQRPGHQDSLRTAIRRLGGVVDVAADHLTTSIRISVPPERWHDALRRLTATMSSVQIERETVQEIQRYQLSALRSTTASSPIRAVVDRLLDHRELGSQARYDALQDIDISDVIVAYGDGYSRRGAILSMVVPDLDASIQLRQAEIILAAWADQEDQPPTQLQTPPLPGKVLWAPTSGDRSMLILLLELPQTDGQNAAAHLIALQALTTDGVGGRLGESLAQIFPHEIGFRAERVGRGGRRYLQLSTHIANSQVTAVIAAFARAVSSLTATPPSADEVATAAKRAVMQLLQDEQTPREWLASSTRGTLVDIELGTSVGQTLAALEHPTILALNNAFAELAQTTPTWIVLGGSPTTTDKSIVVLEDVQFGAEPALVREASETLQSALAMQMLIKTADAMGGRDRILAVAGYAAQSHTQSSIGLQFRDREWLDISGRFRRTRTILATTIDTLIDGSVADERVDNEHRLLDENAVNDRMADCLRHPLLLIRDFLLGEDRYRLIATRTVNDRRMVILELIDPEQPRFRLHVDQSTGLIRVVESLIEMGELGTVPVLDRYRDYRNISGLRIPFHRITQHNLLGTDSETQWELFEIGAQDDSVFARDR